MILPEGLTVGVEARLGGPAPVTPLAEIGGDAVDLPTPEQVREAAAKDAVITLVGWHVITHRRSDARYKKMTSPPPDQSAVGHFERSRWTDEAWEQTDALARAVAAQAVVLRTPSSFKPSADHGTRLENFVAHASRPGLSIAWEWAKGSWPAAKALELCDRIGAVPAVDPLDEPIPDGEFVYLRIGVRSPKKQIRDDDLKKIALEARDRTGWVIFCNTAAAVDAERLQEML